MPTWVNGPTSVSIVPKPSGIPGHYRNTSVFTPARNLSSARLAASHLPSIARCESIFVFTLGNSRTNVSSVQKHSRFREICNVTSWSILENDHTSAVTAVKLSITQVIWEDMSRICTPNWKTRSTNMLVSAYALFYNYQFHFLLYW